MSLDAPDRERRRTADRRRRPTTFWSTLRWRGRRRGFRRQGEGKSQYVDCPSHRVIGLALLVILASVLDALFTLLHVESGAREVNPLMHLALEAGTATFVAVKTAITGLGVILLAAHQHLRLSYVGLHALALTYSGLLGYHGILFLR